jgi:phosphonate transport system ATP-binding protein
MLLIKGLTKRYRTGDLALKGIDLDVPDGQVMALIGPSGAGKSTVIRCINRLVEPSAGTVTLNDIEITTLGRSELRRARRRMGMIFQDTRWSSVWREENGLSGRLTIGSGRVSSGNFRNPTSTRRSATRGRVGLTGRQARRWCPAGSDSAWHHRALIQNGIAAGRRTDRLDPDLAADHAVDQGAVRRTKALRHHQYP